MWIVWLLCWWTSAVKATEVVPAVLAPSDMMETMDNDLLAKVLTTAASSSTNVSTYSNLLDEENRPWIVCDLTPETTGQDSKERLQAQGVDTLLVRSVVGWIDTSPLSLQMRLTRPSPSTTKTT